jgi:DNA polymerase (family X)
MNHVTEKIRFPAADARRVADSIIAVLCPLCDRIQIAGSLRRGRPTVGDIEILYVPKYEMRDVPRENTLFSDRLKISLADERIEQALAAGTIGKRPKKDGSFTWGESNKFAMHTGSRIPVDFFATDERRWWVSLVIRTGSAAMNLELTTAAQRAGKSLLAYGEGVRQPDGSVFRAESEQHVFELCGVPYREPEKR